MPGLSQLKKFNSDILSLGGEPEHRAKRGEKTIPFPLPKGIKDVNDSDDFVMGMPEPVSYGTVAAKKDEPEDFSDIMGGSSAGTPSTSTKSEQSAAVPGISLPDLSSIINAAPTEDMAAPDLSMFMEEPEPEPEVVEKPKEKLIDELSLDDLLGGAGFDGSEGMEDEPPRTEPEYEEDVSGEGGSLEEPFEADFSDSSLSGGIDASVLKPVEPSETKIQSPETAIDRDIEAALGLSSQEPSAKADSNTGVSDFPSLDDALSLDPKIDSDGIEELDASDFAPGESFSLEDFTELNETSPDFSQKDAFSDEDVSDEVLKDEMESFGGIEVTEDSTPVPPSKNIDGADGGFSLPENIGFEEPSADFSAFEEGVEKSDSADGFSDADFSIGGTADDISTGGIPTDGDKVSDVPVKDEFDEGDAASVPAGLFDPADMEMPEGLDENFVNSNFGSEDSSGEFNSENLDVPDFSENFDSAAENTEDAASSADFSDLDFPSDSPETEKNDEKSEIDSFSEANDDFSADETSSNPFADSFDLDAETTSIDLSPGAFDSPENISDGAEASSSDDFAGIDFNLDDNFDSGTEEVDASAFEEGPAPEKFDISAMEGMDFPDTDAQLGGQNGEFEFSNTDTMSFESGDFEIPGYTGENILDEKQQEKLRKKREEAASLEEDEIPPNTLTDEQYAKFLKNLSNYPLNVRIAVEDLIVKNEFTDDAEFEIVQKVLKKVPARNLAAELEKMLDIPISVPRDFERRTAEEYEAYKASLSYQLRNKILPGTILGVAALLACVGLFFFSRNCIYRPLRASSLYRQGYAYIETEDFPQSEIKFNQAYRCRVSKKWLYRYAQGYRSHRQYIRAEQMYCLVLARFKNEKQAGLEYARMNLDDLANYEKAEKILLREVLDHHINDPDGLLLLGDTYLEWATEKDSSKFEDARLRYSELLQLYGGKGFSQNVLYKGRMMRYFVRTDNLLEVLQLKDNFMVKKKTLGADDWTEMSGFLLEKLYGPIDPSQEYLRTKIEDVKEMLMRAVKEDDRNPVALYNLSKYYVYMNNRELSRSALNRTVNAFDAAERIKRRDMYKYIDSYRLLGEEYVQIREYFKAMEQYTRGISLYQSERDGNGFVGDQKVGKLYQDMGDIDYFISGDMESALVNYQSAIETKNDVPEIRYKIGYIKYSSKNYSEALGSFMKAGEDYPDDINFLLAMGNTLSLRDDNFASQGYYEHLIDELNAIIDRKQIMFPQAKPAHAEIVDSYMRGMNNLGVTFYRLAKRTGSSVFNARAMVGFQESLRAWDTLTRNQETMLRLPGGNLAAQNLKYISQPLPSYEPAIYTELPKTLYEEEELR